MRLVLMGTGPFAVPSFKSLVESGHEVCLVVTRPQPPVRSRKGPPPSPVTDWATGLGHDVYQPDSINSAEAIERVAAFDADLLVVCDYGQILKPDALATAKLGGINLHGSLLPAYRGAAPVQRALLSGDAKTGVSVIHMTPRLDGGPVLTTRTTEIRDDETAGELEVRLSELGVDATLEAVETLATWDGESSIGQIQDAAKVSKAARLNKQEAQINWEWPSRQIDCHVRGMQPWPVAYTFVETNPKKPPMRLQIKQVRSFEANATNLSPGQIIGTAILADGTTQDGLFVSSGDGLIEIKQLQPAGKKEMAGLDFLRGYQIEDGKSFVSPS